MLTALTHHGSQRLSLSLSEIAFVPIQWELLRASDTRCALVFGLLNLHRFIDLEVCVPISIGAARIAIESHIKI